MSTEANPARIGRYEIQKPLGSGAMGDVYLAHDPNIDRLVAVKTVRVIGGNDEDIADRRGRLLREARAAGKFQHPNVVALYDAGEAAGLLYLAFEYVPGQDLLKRARQSPEMTLREVLRVVRETASALDYAWHRNVVHRDIKPSNILLGPKGEAKVADFGIAKLQNQSVELTRTGSVVGSPQYMSPEQIRGEELDGRSDIFSLGVVFYELLSRTRPFGGDTISTLVFEILAKEPMPIESLRPGLSQGLVQLVRSMLVKDRNQRIADAGLVVQAIEKLEKEIPAAELNAPASQATGADVQPTMLMPSGAASVPPGPASSLAGSGAAVMPPPPYPTGSNPSAPIGSVPMGAPLPSGPLAPLPSGPLAPMASGAGSPGLAGPPVPPPGWGAPQPNAAMTPPPMTQHPPGPPVPPLPYQQPAPPSHAQPPGPPPGYGQHPPYGQPVPPPQHGHPQPAYGAPAPRPNYPSAKPTSPIKLLLLLGGLGLFGVVGIVVLFLMFGGDDTPKSTPDPTTAGSEAPPPPPDGSTDSGEPEPLVTATVQTGPIGESPSDTTTEPTWNEPRPTTAPESTTDSGDTAAPAPTPAPRNPGSGRQNDGGGALARLGEAIGGDDPAAGGDSTDSGDTADVADNEPSPRPRIPVPETNSAWQAAAASANSEMETGLRFQFKVTPPEAKVLFWPRDDRRAIVQGSAGEFDPKKDEDARVLELPDDGEYLILLRHGDFPDHVIHVHADRSRGQRPKLLQLSLGRGGGGSGSGNTASSIKVSRGVSFAGTPGDAYVFVDGRAQGRASDYPGGEKRSAANLKLDRGKHVVRLEAPGFKSLEIRVEVGSGAPAVEQITYRLEKE